MKLPTMEEQNKMKKLFALLMTGIFLIPLTLAFAQAPAAGEKKAETKAETKEAAPKKAKKKKAAKPAAEKKEAAPAAAK